MEIQLPEISALSPVNEAISDDHLYITIVTNGLVVIGLATTVMIAACCLWIGTRTYAPSKGRYGTIFRTEGATQRCATVRQKIRFAGFAVRATVQDNEPTAGDRRGHNTSKAWGNGKIAETGAYQVCRFAGH